MLASVGCAPLRGEAKSPIIIIILTTIIIIIIGSSPLHDGNHQCRAGIRHSALHCTTQSPIGRAKSRARQRHRGANAGSPARDSPDSLALVREPGMPVGTRRDS